MSTLDSLYPSDTNQIIKSFSSLVRGFSSRETAWAIEKESLERRIAVLEGEVSAHENINIDLLKRVRMLEYELARERGKDIEKKDKDNNNIEELKYPNLIKESDLKILEESLKKPSLLSVLNSIGINEKLAENLFTDFDLNKKELENLIEKDIEKKLKMVKIEDNTNNKELNILKNRTLPENNIKDKSQEIKHNSTFNLSKCIELRSHFDEVRKLAYIPNINALVSVSEDCLVKVWSMDNINFNSQSADIEPYIHLRGHTGPLFCACHGKDNMLFTGGIEGVIQIWNVPSPREVSSFGTSEETYQINVGYYQNCDEGEIYWDLKHHPSSPLLVSLSSDGLISFWSTVDPDQYLSFFSSPSPSPSPFLKAKKKFADDATPVVCEFFPGGEKIVVGFNDDKVAIVDVNKFSFISSYDLYKNKKKDEQERILYQPNAFAIPSSSPSIIYVGTEEGKVRIFDLREKNENFFSAGEISKVHNDAITSLCLLDDVYLFSSSHDTTIKVIDVRRPSLATAALSAAVASQKKWDEAMWDILIEHGTLCVACADSTVKLYRL